MIKFRSDYTPATRTEAEAIALRSALLADRWDLACQAQTPDVLARTADVDGLLAHLDRLLMTP